MLDLLTIKLNWNRVVNDESLIDFSDVCERTKSVCWSSNG